MDLTLKEKAGEKIKQMILEGKLLPGGHIVEEKLATALKMSRVPVREALFELEADGLIRRAGPRTRVITEVTLKDMIDVYEIREMFEGMAARLLAPHVSQEQLDYLQKLAKRCDKLPCPEDIERDFHSSIAGWCGNSHLITLYNGARIRMMMNQMKALLSRSQNYINDYHNVDVTHAEIVTALASQDPDRAEAAARGHVSNLKKPLFAKDATV